MRPKGQKTIRTFVPMGDLLIVKQMDEIAKGQESELQAWLKNEHSRMESCVQIFASNN